MERYSYNMIYVLTLNGVEDGLSAEVHHREWEIAMKDVCYQVKEGAIGTLRILRKDKTRKRIDAAAFKD